MWYYFIKLCLAVLEFFARLQNCYPQPWYSDDPYVFLGVFVALFLFGRFLFSPSLANSEGDDDDDPPAPALGVVVVQHDNDCTRVPLPP